MPLDLSSEPFAASGGFAGEGARRLMGAPALTALQTVLRESGQNSWDARSADSIRIRIALRTLTRAQTVFLRAEILHSLPDGEAAEELNPLLEAEDVTVLEICDFGTKGLAGPTRADISEGDEESANFVNFIRNIGARRGVEQGGGTYGYGKMALFAASRCSAVLVDSVAKRGDAHVRRFIGCHVGDEFISMTGRRYTGRHWWGLKPDRDDAPEGAPWYVEPATGDEAQRLADGLGLPDRAADATGLGTSVQILLPDVDPQTAIQEIRDALLWFFWPKMIALEAQPVPISFELFHEAEPVVLPSPERFPPLELFVEAWRAVKTRSEISSVIRSTSPTRLTGRMAISRGFRNDRLTSDSANLIPAISHHVALMRPVELVVRYLAGPPLPGEDLEWAGVFICDDAPCIEAAFAAAEPPAHDDWNPESLADRTAKRIVSQTLKAIRTSAERQVYPAARPATSNAEQPPLAAAASRLGRMLPMDPEARPAPRVSGLSGRRRVWRIEAPVFVSLRKREDGVEALFSLIAVNSSSEPLIIHAAPGLVIDDRLSREVFLPGGGEVAVVGWSADASGTEFEGAVAELPPRSRADFVVRVHVPGSAAIGLHISAED